jgi:hypothetical protein
MKVKLRRTWFGPTDIHRPDKTREMSGGRYRADVIHDFPESFRKLLPKDAIILDDPKPEPSPEVVERVEALVEQTTPAPAPERTLDKLTELAQKVAPEREVSVEEVAAEQIAAADDEDARLEAQRQAFLREVAGKAPPPVPVSKGKSRK